MEIERRYGVATIITYPLVDADGDPVTGATTPDSEIDGWSDGVAPNGFTDCTNEATEIGTTGQYSLSLTAAEMRAQYNIVQTKSGNAKTQTILIRTLPSGALATGLATAGAATTLTIGTGFAVKRGQLLELHGGTNAGEMKVVRSYNSGTGVVTIDGTWAVTPDNTSLWTLWPGPASVSGAIASGIIGSTGNSTSVLHLTGQPHGDDEFNDHLLVALDVSAGEYHARWIDDWADTGDLATLAAPVLPFTPENAVDEYWVLPIRRDVLLSAGGSKVLTESYAADGAAATLPQLLYFLLAALTEFSVSGTTATLKKLDGSTTAGTLTLSDAADPTSITRAS